MNAIATKLSAKTLGAQVKATGTLGSAQQVINAEVDNIFFDKILPYLPEDTILRISEHICQSIRFSVPPLYDRDGFFAFDPRSRRVERFFLFDHSPENVIGMIVRISPASKS